MKNSIWVKVDGVVVEGHRLASGMAQSDRYPEGTIPVQIPVFRQLGLDLSGCYPGTLNVSIAPKTFELVTPRYHFREVKWLEWHIPENFSFARCRITFRDACYEGWVYYPDPKTKERFIHKPSTFELLAPRIPDITYGDRVTLEFRPSEVRLC